MPVVDETPPERFSERSLLIQQECLTPLLAPCGQVAVVEPHGGFTLPARAAHGLEREVTKAIAHPEEADADATEALVAARRCHHSANECPQDEGAEPCGVMMQREVALVVRPCAVTRMRKELVG